jgi:hypothetical protein
MNPETIQKLIARDNYKKITDDENNHYFGKTIFLEKKILKIRTGKKTPTYKGHFIAFYKKEENKISSYEKNDFDFLILLTQSENEKQGIYIFPNAFLEHIKILKTKNQKGKYGFRTKNIFEKETTKKEKQYEKYDIYFYILNKTDYTFFETL